MAHLVYWSFFITNNLKLFNSELSSCINRPRPHTILILISGESKNFYRNMIEKVSQNVDFSGVKLLSYYK